MKKMLVTDALSAKDLELLEAAREALQKMYRPKQHCLSSALRTKEGKVFVGLHIGAKVGNCAICAEAVALGIALSAGEQEFDTIVAVQYNRLSKTTIVVSPCGRCRELLGEYGDIMVILSTAGRLGKISVRSLLPYPYLDPMGMA